VVRRIWHVGSGGFCPATSSTLFRLGSISKPITAVAVLQLHERGKLDLDASVQQYCPAFPKKEWPITSRELLGPRRIRHYNEGEKEIFRRQRPAFSSMEESLQIFAVTAGRETRRLNSITRRMAIRSWAASWRVPRRRSTWIS